MDRVSQSDRIGDGACLRPGSTVAVGMSGGVDSSIAALLLQREGYRVLGLTMLTWDGSVPLADKGKSGCYGPGEARDLECAREQAARIGIPHFAVPMTEAYRTEVLDYVRSEYMAGRTPNPCVRCNRMVKFGALPRQAREAGIAFDAFATGHYARVAYAEERKRYRLMKAVDRKKDQSYFLSHLTQAQLRATLFPLGALTKLQVRELAREMGWLELSEKEESQDFLEADDFGCLFPAGAARPGPILDLEGRVLGAHRGIMHYTVGQRKGLGLGGTDAPLYVVRIDGPSNTLVVGAREQLFTRRLRATDLSWIALPDAPEAPLRAWARIRQQHQEASALILPPDPRTGAVEVVFDEAQMAAAPGQAVVFYDGETVLGGGTIAAAW